MSTGGESANVEPTVVNEAIESDSDETDGDDGEDSIPTYEEWLAKNKDIGAKKETKGGKSEDAKAKQAEGKADEKARDPKASKDSDGAKDSADDVSGKGIGKDRPAETFKLKVDGEEIELTKEQAIARLQKSEAAELRIKEATEIKKQAGEFINFFKKNPIEALNRVGVDFDKLAEDRIYEKLQYNAMSEQERKAHDTAKALKDKETELSKYKEAEEKAAKEAQARAEKERIEKATNEARTVLERQFIQAMESSGLPNTKYTVTRMALYMKDALSKGHKNITPMDVVDLVKQDYADEIEKARKADVKNFKSQPMKEQEPRVTGHRPAKSAKRRISSIYDLID